MDAVSPASSDCFSPDTSPYLEDKDEERLLTLMGTFDSGLSLPFAHSVDISVSN